MSEERISHWHMECEIHMDSVIWIWNDIASMGIPCCVPSGWWVTIIVKSHSYYELLSSKRWVHQENNVYFVYRSMSLTSNINYKTGFTVHTCTIHIRTTNMTSDIISAKNTFAFIDIIRSKIGGCFIVLTERHY